MELTREQRSIFRNRIARLYGNEWRAFSRRERQVLVDLWMEDFVQSDEYRAFQAFVRKVAPYSRNVQ